MAGGNRAGAGVSSRRSDLAVHIPSRVREHRYSRSLRAGCYALKEFKGRLHGVVVCNLAGICIVHIAAANVWLPILDSDAVGDGEISPGSILAVVDVAADLSSVGQYAWIVHHRNRCSGLVSVCRIVFF